MKNMEQHEKNHIINTKKRKNNNENNDDDVNKGKILKKMKKKQNDDNIGKCKENLCQNKIKYKKTLLCENHGRKLRLKTITLEHGNHCIFGPCSNNIRRRLLCDKHNALYKQNNKYV